MDMHELNIELLDRYLLGFGQVTYYLGYSALKDFFPTMKMKPNSSCEDTFCLRRQREFLVSEQPLGPVIGYMVRNGLIYCFFFQEKEANIPKLIEEPQEERVIHTENEWGKKKFLTINSYTNVLNNAENSYRYMCSIGN